MQIAHTVLKKKTIISLITCCVIAGTGGIIYIVNHYGNSTAKAKEEKPVDLPSGANVNVTVNNFMNIPLHKTAASDALADAESDSKPPIIVPSITDNKVAAQSNTHNMGQLMAQPPVTATQPPPAPKLNMLVVGNSATDNNNQNAITGTNTTVGSGEIDSKLANQRSPYTLFAGSFIPAVMVTGLNSDLNGVLVASIRNNVYDTTAGKYLLIPQGSRLIGTYNHDLAYAQNRLMVGWNRIIYPNGTSFLLRGQPGTDLQGFSGFTGEVDNHYLQIFGSSFLMGLIFGGSTAATGNQSSNPYQLSAGATIASQVGAQMAQTGLQVVSKGLNIPPTIVVSPGYKFNVLTTADLVLKPYVYSN